MRRRIHCVQIYVDVYGDFMLLRGRNSPKRKRGAPPPPPPFLWWNISDRTRAQDHLSAGGGRGDGRARGIVAHAPPGACSGSVSYSPNAGTLDRKKRRKTHLIKAQPSEFQLSFPFWIDKRLLVGRNREIPPLPLPGCRSTPPPFSIPSFGGETKATSGYIHWKRERGGGKGEAF